MIQSIKVDIVYYTIGSDFEMEFNLCGCCRMRLLTDKVEGQSEFSKSLSKAVKRSRVIILCGPLFGEKGLIYTVSKVTGIEMEKLDKSAYDLSSDADIDILKGSTALISDDGVFGGCIIESSTQSIIILSESKSLRKNIMKQLIYPYITKLSISPVEPLITEPVVTERKSDDATEDDTAPLQSEKNFENAVTDTATVDEPVAEVPGDSLSEENTNEPDDDFVIDISNTDLAKTASKAPDDNFDDSLIFDIDRGSNFDDGLTVEERNNKYYLFDENEEQQPNSNGYGIAIRIIIAFIVLIAALIIYIAVVKPIMLHKDVLENLRNMFSVSVFKFLL